MGLRIIHGKNLDTRYHEVSKIIGKNKKVLDLGCGTCILKKYLDKSCDYEGWDLNKRFIQKNRHLNVKLKNVMDYKDYPKADVIVISDLLHHIVPHHEEIIKKAVKKAKKTIIIEPVCNWVRNELTKKIMRIIDPIILDDDGINSFKNRMNWFACKEETYKFFKKFKPKLIKELGKDLIVLI